MAIFFRILLEVVRSWCCSLPRVGQTRRYWPWHENQTELIYVRERIVTVNGALIRDLELLPFVYPATELLYL